MQGQHQQMKSHELDPMLEQKHFHKRAITKHKHPLLQVNKSQKEKNDASEAFDTLLEH